MTRRADLSDRKIVKRAIGAKLRPGIKPPPPVARFVVDAPITIWCEKIGKAPFIARFFDRTDGQFYSGSGSTPWLAIAWCMDEYVNRGVLGRGPMAARNSDARPGDFVRAQIAS